MFRTKITNTRIKRSNYNNNLAKLQQLKPNKLLNGYHRMIKNYVKGLLHPELSVTGNFIPKAPNYVSIPTSNITFREAFDIVPDANGEFILFWTPNFLATNETILKRAHPPEEYNGKMEYSRNWLGGFDDQYNCFCYVPMPAYKPPASFTKYRLVSAGCKITYKGPTINRAGIISHCLSYRGFPVTYFVKDTNNIISAEALYTSQRYGNSINEIATTSIQNGMWNSVVNVQKNQTSYSVAIPTDPSDFIFEDDGYFYASATAVDDVPLVSTTWVDGNGNNVEFIGAPQLPEDGTPCSYIFKGTDLTQNAKLYVEQFYNFEVIPTEESAPVLRPRVQNMSSSDLEYSKSLSNKILNSVRGEVGNLAGYSLDNLLNETISSLPSQIPMTNTMVYENKNKNVSQSRPRSKSFGAKAKDFGKNLWKESKSVLKDVANVAFSKENVANLANSIAQILINRGVK